MTRRIALLLLMIGSSAWAEDWPQWRGPNRDNAWNEKGTLQTFPAGGLEITWRAPVAVGFSSPIVAGGKVYVTDTEYYNDNKAARERTLCFDEQTGKPLWSHVEELKYPDWAFSDPNNKVGPTATPIVRNGKLYTLGSFGNLLCLDAAKGDVLWHRDIQKDYPKEIGCRSSPLIEGDLLILFAGAKPAPCAMAINRHTGKDVWKALNESSTHSSPIIITAGGTRQLILWTQESISSLDPADGKLLWRQNLATQSDYVVSTPVCNGDSLLFGGLMMKLDADKPAAAVMWPKSKAVGGRVFSTTSTPIIQGDLIVSAKSTGQLIGVDAATGEQLWETDKVTDNGNGASIHLTPNVDSTLLYTDRGELIRAKLTREGYIELARAKLIEPTFPFGARKRAWAQPAYANKHVFVRSDKELVCASLKIEK